MPERAKEVFENHVVELALNNKKTGVQVINYRKPNTGMYAMRIILDGYYIHISGDVGTATYRTTWINDILKTDYQSLHVGYFSEKLVSCKRDKYELDKDKARKDIKEFYEDILESEFDDEQLALLFNPDKSASDIKFDIYVEYEEMLENTDVKNVIKFYEILEDYDAYEHFTSVVASSRILETDNHDLWESFQSIGRTLSYSMHWYLYAIKDIAKQLQGSEVSGG